ncbi:ArsR/SmtB family transcription factor [Streptomyces sp. NPDC059534]|uniref:ArsR/SmtB family transcription factor n=1 Tax=Streptomyces sp. NPDC059534 TaxID=3346859 RepID=UPI00369FEB34
MAVEIKLTAAEVARVRFAVSPLSETVLGVRLALRAGGHAVHRRWVHEAREVLSTEPDAGLLRLLLGGSPPSFLFPVPERRLPDPADEFARLAATDPDFFRTECVAGLGTAATRRLGDPREALHRIGTALRRCHDLLVAPHWGRMRAVLDADVAKRALALVDGGVEGLFADLHGDVAWREGELLVHGRRGTGDAPCTVEADGHGLVLMPSIFTWPQVLVDTSPIGAASIRYPATGMGLLWEEEPPTPDGLALVLGHTRAALLAALAEPMSTPALAARLGVTPSAVSQHLGALRAAALVATHRTGRTALHLRTSRATHLLHGESQAPSDSEPAGIGT